MYSEVVLETKTSDNDEQQAEAEAYLNGSDTPASVGAGEESAPLNHAEDARERKEEQAETRAVEEEDDDDDEPPTEPLLLHRQLSSRSGALQLVGLGMYRDQLVELGLHSLDAIDVINEDVLVSLGMSSVQRACFEALRDDIKARQRQQEEGAADTDEEECVICCEPSSDLTSNKCCNNPVCGNCFRGYMTTTGNFHSCPACNSDDHVSVETSAALLLNHCACCGLPLTISGNTLQLRCGFEHRAHAECLNRYMASCLKTKEYPVACPAGQLCKCNVAEITVLECLAADEESLRRYYDAALDHAQRRHGFMRQCPNSQCGHTIDLGTSRIAGSRAIRCSHCHKNWCSQCELPAHPGVACDEYNIVNQTWMKFLQSQDIANVSEQIKADMQNFLDLCASEKFKADNMKHCPHCGLVTFKTDGCSSVTCGADAPDKGGTRHSDLGCGQNFNWDQARRYEAKCTAEEYDVHQKAKGVGEGDSDLSDPLSVRTSGVMIPRRLCSACYEPIRGTCFEELAPAALAMNANPALFLDHVDKQRRRLIPTFSRHFRFTDLSVLDAKTAGRSLANVLRERPNPKVSNCRFPVDEHSPTPTVTLVLLAGSLGETEGAKRDHLSKIRARFNKPRFQQESPVAVHVRCIFSVKRHAVDSSLPFVAQVETDTALFRSHTALLSKLAADDDVQFMVKLPTVQAPSNRAWQTLVTRQQVVEGLLNHFGASLTAAEIYQLYESLLLVELVLDCGSAKSTRNCAIEQIEVYGAPEIPPGVQHSLNTLAGSQPTAGIANLGYGPSATATKLGVCWACMRKVLAGQDTSRDRSKVGDGKKPFRVGDLVVLSAAFQAPSNLDAAEGPLKKGQFGFVCEAMASSPIQIQPVHVRTFDGADWWYTVDSLTAITDPTLAGFGSTADAVHPVSQQPSSANSLYRVIQPLLPDQVRTEILKLNKSFAQVPVDQLGGCLGDAGDTVPTTPQGQKGSITDRLVTLLRRLEAVNHIVQHFRCVEADEYAVRACDYLFRTVEPYDLAQLEQQEVQAWESNEPEIAKTLLLARLRSACVEAVGTMERCVEATIPRNSAGATMAPGTGLFAGTMYCARVLGRAAIPGSDGQCGPNDGPQCADCRRTAPPKAVPGASSSSLKVLSKGVNGISGPCGHPLKPGVAVGGQCDGCDAPVVRGLEGMQCADSCSSFLCETCFQKEKDAFDKAIAEETQHSPPASPVARKARNHELFTGSWGVEEGPPIGEIGQAQSSAGSTFVFRFRWATPPNGTMMIDEGCKFVGEQIEHRQADGGIMATNYAVEDGTFDDIHPSPSADGAPHNAGAVILRARVSWRVDAGARGHCFMHGNLVIRAATSGRPPTMKIVNGIIARRELDGGSVCDASFTGERFRATDGARFRPMTLATSDPEEEQQLCQTRLLCAQVYARCFRMYSSVRDMCLLRASIRALQTGTAAAHKKMQVPPQGGSGKDVDASMAALAGARQAELEHIKIGTRIKSRYKNGGTWYNGHISSRDDSSEEPSYGIQYDDGDREANVPRDRIQVLDATSAPSILPADVVVAQTNPRSQMELPEALQTALRSTGELSTAQKLWLELELSSRPCVLAAEPHAEVKKDTRRMQNLQRGDFVGEIRAIVLHATEGVLSNLWILIYRIANLTRCGQSGAATLISSHSVGSRVVAVQDSMALLLLNHPITVGENDVIAFTTITNDGIQSPQLDTAVAATQIARPLVPDLQLDLSSTWVGAGQNLEHGVRATAVAETDVAHARSGEHPRRVIMAHIFGNGSTMRGKIHSREEVGCDGTYTVTIERDEQGLAGFRVFQSNLQVTGTQSNHSGGAHRQGLRDGHIIVAVDGKPVKVWREYKDLAYGNPKFELTMLDKTQLSTKRPKIPDQFWEQKVTTSPLNFATGAQGASPSTPGLESQFIGGALSLGLLQPHESLRVARNALRMAIGGLETWRERAPRRLPLDEVPNLIRRDWRMLCIDSGDLDDDGSSTELSAGESVLVRRDEVRGFDSRGVVLSSKIKLSATVVQSIGEDGNRNKLVALSDLERMTVVQVNERDLRRMEPHVRSWVQCPSVIVQHLREQSKRVGPGEQVGRAEALIRTAPFLLGHTDLGLTDTQWILDQLKLIATPLDEAAQMDQALLSCSVAAAKLIAAEPERRRKAAARRQRLAAQLLAAERARARSKVLPVPSCVSNLLNGRYTYISDRHRTMIKESIPWTVLALKYAHVDREIQEKVQLLLGTFQFTQCLSWAQPAWTTLRAKLDEELERIAKSLEDIYVAENLGKSLGELDLAIIEDCTGRQDCRGGLATPPEVAALLAAQSEQPSDHFGCEVQTIDVETAYIHYLRLVGIAMRESFGRDVENHIGHLLGGTSRFEVAPVKSFTRMLNRFSSFDDHWQAPVPRPAENLDVVRGLGVFENAETLGAAIGQLQRAYGPMAKFRNGMSLSTAEAREISGLRTLELGVQFNTKRTFGDLCKDPHVQEQWAQYCSADKVSEIAGGISGHGPWRRGIETALRWLRSTALQNEPVSMVCEIRLMLESYQSESHRIFAMQRVKRAPTAIALHADFVRYFKEANAEREWLRDSGSTGTGRFSQLKNQVFAGEFGVATTGTDGGASPGETPSLVDLTDRQIAVLLSVSSKYGHATTAKSLLDAGTSQKRDLVKILHTSGEGYHFPLFHAANGQVTASRVAILDMLLEAKASVNTTTPGGCSALWKAANEGHRDAVELLITHKADVNLSQSDTQISPLYNACYRGHDGIVSLLINAKANIHMQRVQTGATPLYTCAENGHVHAIQLLVKAKASVNEVTTKTHSSPLYIAAQNGRMPVIHLLAQLKADVHLSRKADGCTPFYAAADKGSCEILRYLAALKADVDKTTTNGAWCALRIAAYRNFSPAIRTIIELGASKESIQSAVGQSTVPEIEQILKEALAAKK